MPKASLTSSRSKSPVGESPSTGSDAGCARARTISLLAALVAYAIFQALWVSVTPLKMQSLGDSLPNGDTRQVLVGTGPDEPQHYLYILSIAQNGQIPRPLPQLRRSPSEFISHEAQHPPLFYLVGAALRNLVHPVGDSAVWYVLRAFGVVCGAVAIWLISWAAWIAFPERPFIGIALPPFLALLPMFDYMTSELSNFPLELALTSAGWLILAMVARERRPLNAASGAALAVLFGLAAETRQTSAMWMPAVALVMAFVMKHSVAEKRRAAVAGAAVFVVVYALLALPWFVYMKVNYGAFMFRSDFRPMLGNISLLQWLSNSTQALIVPNMPNRPHCSILQTVLWYASTAWTPLWIAQFTLPAWLGSLEAYQAPFLIADVAVLLLLFRHSSEVRHSARAADDRVGRVLLWSCFLSVAVSVVLVMQQQFYVDIEMFLYSGRYFLSLIAASSLVLLFGLSTLTGSSCRAAVIGAVSVAAVMLLFDAWTYNLVHQFYTVGIAGL